MMFGMFFWWIFFILIIVAVVYFIQSAAGGRNVSGFGQREDPLETLKIRYAKGEISKEQFEQMKRDLGG